MFPAHIITFHLPCKLVSPIYIKITIIMVLYISKYICWIIQFPEEEFVILIHSKCIFFFLPEVLFGKAWNIGKSGWKKMTFNLLLPSLLESFKVPPAGTTAFECQQKPLILWCIRKREAVWPPSEKDINLEDLRKTLHSILTGSIYLSER